MPVMEPLLIESGPSSQPNADLIRRHAEGLAREIQSDVMAKEDEIADAIEAAIRRFAGRCVSKRWKGEGEMTRCVKHKHHKGQHFSPRGKRWRQA